MADEPLAMANFLLFKGPLGSIPLRIKLLLE